MADDGLSHDAVLQQMVLDGRRPVFALTLSEGHATTSGAYAAVRQIWRRFWLDTGYSEDEVPALLLMPHGSKLQALSDATLVEYGLMRIPGRA